MLANRSHSTQELILEAGKQEFLEFGFERASLRVIAQRAGVTTGAIYGYYPDKAALFDAIVLDSAEALYQSYVDTVANFERLSFEDQCGSMEGMTAQEVEKWLSMIYTDLDAFKLVFSRSSGTRWEGYLDSLAKIEEDSSLAFIHELRKVDPKAPKVSPHMIHMLSSAYFQAIAEVVLHDMAFEEAVEYITSLHEFFTAGWGKLLKMSW